MLGVVQKKCRVLKRDRIACIRYETKFHIREKLSLFDIQLLYCVIKSVIPN